MRHGKKINHLSRKTAHRRAMLSNMATSIILHKRIFTTVAKAKALKKYVEPLITKSKDDTTHSRRVVFSYLQDKESVTELFGDVAARVATRPGGYTRIIKTGNRLGDNAEMCMIELVDYNEVYGSEAKPAKAKTRRSRRGASGKSDATEAKTEEKKPKATEKKEAKAEQVATTEGVEEAKAETDTTEEVKAEATTTEEQPKEDNSGDDAETSEEEKKAE